MWLILQIVIGIFAVIGFVLSTMVSIVVTQEKLDNRAKAKSCDDDDDDDNEEEYITLIEYDYILGEEKKKAENILGQSGFNHFTFVKTPPSEPDNSSVVWYADIDLDWTEIIAYWCGQYNIIYCKTFIRVNELVRLDSGEDEYRQTYGYVYGFRNKEDLANFILRWDE